MIKVEVSLRRPLQAVCFSSLALESPLIRPVPGQPTALGLKLWDEATAATDEVRSRCERQFVLSL